MTALKSTQFNYTMNIFVDIRTEGIDYFKPGKMCLPICINREYKKILFYIFLLGGGGICSNDRYVTFNQFLQNPKIDDKKLYSLLQSELEHQEFSSIITHNSAAISTLPSALSHTNFILFYIFLLWGGGGISSNERYLTFIQFLQNPRIDDKKLNSLLQSELEHQEFSSRNPHLPSALSHCSRG